MEYIIQNQVGEFWTGSNWANEYPEALVYTKEGKAIDAARKAYGKDVSTGVNVICAYGYDDQETVFTLSAIEA